MASTYNVDIGIERIKTRRHVKYVYYLVTTSIKTHGNKSSAYHIPRIIYQKLHTVYVDSALDRRVTILSSSKM